MQGGAVTALGGHRAAGLLCCLLLWGAAQRAGAEDLKASLDEKGFALATPDDLVAFELGGRLQADFGTGGSRAVRGEFPEHTDFRRVRIEPKITIDKDLILGFQYELRDPVDRIRNLLVSYKGFPSVTLTAGQFKEPFSLERLGSSNDTAFLERSLSQTFAPARNTGAAIGARGRNWTMSAGIFGGNLNTSVDRGGLAATARATVAPLLDDDHVLHLGVAGGYRSLDRRGPDLAFDARPESFLFGTPLVDTGAIEGARAVGRLGLEGAYLNGPFRLQAEYVATRVERAGSPDLSFDGSYVYAAWVLNGAGPRYALDGDTATEVAVFGRVQPADGQRVSQGGVGVFELAARYSAISLSSREVRGGFEQDVTAGLNWYPEPFVRVLANYVRAWADPSASAVTGRPARADIGQLRVQIAF